MTERDLAALKNAPVPTPRAQARSEAIDRAVAAFDEAAKPRAAQAQGNVEPERLRKTSNRGSFPMNLTSRHSMAIAASLAALVVVAPFAFQHIRNADLVPSLESGDKGAPEPAKEIATTPAPAKVADNRPVSHMKKKAGKASGGDVRPAGALAPAQPAPPPPVVGGLMARLGSGNQLGGSGRLYRNAPADMLTAQSAGSLAGSYEKREEVLPRSALEQKRDRFDTTPVNPVKQVATEPVSTFSIDVDTASYSFVRRALTSGYLPPKQAVRVEEMINYFPYAYPAPDNAETPFKPTITVVPCPWKPTDRLVHIAIKGYDLKQAERPRANLVFLIDVSGSMEPEDRLPLVKNALRMLVEELRPDDTVGIVTYASGSGIALEPTRISDRAKIIAAIDKLDAGGSTAGAAGIADAYRLAQAGFDKAAVNRIVLATDGDFNVGLTDGDQLESYIEKKRKSGIFLSILGVGVGNHNDALMQKLAQNGNGTAAYVDTLNEARKVLVDEASSTLFTIAKDVKLQVEWNPARVSEYRLIGYETRALKQEDFNNDQVDAGDIGSGHAVTAIYEVTPVGAPRLVDDLRYAKPATHPAPETNGSVSDQEYGFLKIRYKKPDGDTSQLISTPISEGLAKTSIADASDDVRFSVAVAAFGDLLRGAPYVGGYTFDDVIALAQKARGDDPFGYRAEFLNLARLAKSARP